jgi:hypothetical protein
MLVVVAEQFLVVTLDVLGELHNLLDVEFAVRCCEVELERALVGSLD